MAHIIKSRVRETSVSIGTGAFALGGAVQDNRRFRDVMSNGDTTWYVIVHPGAAEWEVGLGTYSGADTLTRTTVLESTNADAAVSFTAGIKEVFIGLPPGKLGSADAQQANSVGTASIVDGAVTLAKLDAAVIPTGTVWLTLANAAPSGWRMFDDGTIGDASSGATSASSVNQALFTLIYTNILDANAPILTSAGGATTRAAQTNAATAWAAHCRISLPKTLGRALAVAGAGSGLTSRALGVTAGAETHTLTTAQLPTITPAGTVAISPNGHDHPITAKSNALGFGAGALAQASGAADTTLPGTVQSTSLDAAFTGTPFGSGTSHNNMQPSSFLNAMVKL
jgi:microcystin-dependent protein